MSCGNTVDYIRTVGAPRETMTAALEAFKRLDGIEVNVSGRYGDLAVEITRSDNVPKNEYSVVYRNAVSILNEYIYALENVPLADRLVQLLKLRKAIFSVAESFTGGGVGKRIVEISGASEIFFEGLNTYSNKSKIERLGVEEEVIEKYGAVSKETAYQMALGLLKSGNCDISVSTTGIAGPNSDGTNKPVGLVYIGIGYGGEVKVYGYNIKGTRQEITETAINFALFLAFKTVK